MTTMTTMTTMIAIQELIDAAVNDLLEAASGLEKQTVPATALPRGREFVIASTVTWPGWRGNHTLPRGKVYMYQHFRLNHDERNEHNASLTITRATEGQPRKVLRALRRIQAATAWCQARTAGRQRQAQEILRQQAGAAEILEAEAVMHSMKR